MASDVMCLCVVLLFSGLQFTTGCAVVLSYITCSPGESVLLPCRDINSHLTEVQWWVGDSQTQTLHYSVSPLDVIKGQRYKDRVQIQGNLSLSITRLNVDDAGMYWCKTTETDKERNVYLHVQGCSLSGNEGSVEISRYSGESVLLSCLVKCSARHEPDSEFRWKLPNYREINLNINSAELSRLYQGRFQMFDIKSGNLSLLISNLTEEDEGLYSCWSKENQHKSFTLTVKGCTLSETEREPKTKYTGDSVLLSCSCKDPKTNPKHFRWTHVESSGTEVSSQTLRYKDRVHTFHKTTPSNLSLLISNLTEDDQGTYRCTVNNKTSADTRLIVKGCVLSKHHITKSSHPGGSVILPCSCEDPKTRPEHFEWKRAAVNETLVSDAEEINGRFQTIRDSPHNLSLRISNLTETDRGLYVCSVNGKQSRHVNLALTDSAVINPLDYQYYLIFLICLMLLLATGCIYRRFNQRAKGGRREIQRSNDEDDVTYSSVTQIKGKKRPCKKEEEVVYSTMADMSRSTREEVYSSVVHIKSHKPQSRLMNTEEAVVYASVQKEKT
ncbi:carcinoembryonic antigen-related cell adhesion molecule 5 [Carassius gibelio]|uniref:carcinoembryonic antigen-related cell adhesion molecule 5 n=1 Tax=Carassius gibelio TaxID=101364 RepID=UPI002278CBC9|nr:carcinoembryonic antigen-related cell adhesion molecule 5 [Carassius gibelio]